MNEQKYYLYDFYEGYDQVGVFGSIEDATDAAREYDAETDGECDLALLTAPIEREYDLETNKILTVPYFDNIIDDWRY